MNAFEEFNPVAVELIAEFGTPATLTRSSINPAQRTAAKTNPLARVPEVQVTATFAVRVEPTTYKDEAGREQSGSLMYLVATPQINDKLEQGGRSYKVVSVSTYNPQGQDIYSEAVVSEN